MNYVVAMKQVPDLQQLRIRDRKPVLTDIPLEFGKIDKNALECAVSLKEEQQDGEVIIVSVGNGELVETLKDGLASGGDRASIIADDAADSLQSSDCAVLLASLIKELDEVGLVFFAEGSADNYSGQVGSRVAQLLGYPQVGFACAVRIEGDKAVVTRALEHSFEELEVTMPAVVIVAADLNKPRLPSVMQILKAGKKPQEVKTLSNLAFEPTACTNCLDNLAPETDRMMQELVGSDEICDVLKEHRIIE